jgi:serine/threonine-protein kinase
MSLCISLSFQLPRCVHDEKRHRRTCEAVYAEQSFQIENCNPLNAREWLSVGAQRYLRLLLQFGAFDLLSAWKMPRRRMSALRWEFRGVRSTHCKALFNHLFCRFMLGEDAHRRSVEPDDDNECVTKVELESKSPQGLVSQIEFHVEEEDWAPRSEPRHVCADPDAPPSGETETNFAWDACPPTIQTPLEPRSTASGANELVGETEAGGTFFEVDERSAGFPLLQWDLYTPVRFLGQGGMGKVFLAYDNRLHREVALKFVRHENPSHSHRLLEEARAQASVDHECVCKVFEVGEVRGQVYIAMQFINGRTLESVIGDLSIEQKVELVRDAALGVHEAHGAGIVHRDLKPANIIVEKSEDGKLKPYVMDFGLALFAEEGGTETASILGTPNYMSPEQARGEVNRLDRRTDVYSLGATLYFALTGQNALSGSNPLEVLTNIADSLPVPLRRLNPEIPSDLEAIVLKCLEKERASRYDSARALADDLKRFLVQEAVEAHAARPWYRLRKFIARKRQAIAFSSVLVGAIVLALGLRLAERRKAAENERLTQRFTELAERIESRSRYSALSRLHDVRADRVVIRERIRELESEMARAGAIARGPGFYALGRGYLALADEAKAKEAFETAWSEGYHEPRVAYALAVVLGHLYFDHLRESERTANKEIRAAKRREIEALYRDPALEYMRHSAGAEVPSSAFVAALVAFYEGRYEEALTNLDGIGDAPPWFYEAEELRGDIYEARAAQRSNSGDVNGATADFTAGRAAYLAAIAIGESVPGIHVALGELEYAAMIAAFYGPGEIRTHFEKGVAAVERALEVQPGHFAATLLLARLYGRFAEHEAARGEKVDELLSIGLKLARSALDAQPNSAHARFELGRIYYLRGNYRESQALDPRGDLQLAAELFAKNGHLVGGYDVNLYLGLTYQTLSEYFDRVGEDAAAARRQAIDSYVAATQYDPGQIHAWINLGATYLAQALAPRNPDPERDFNRALASLDRANALNPDHYVPLFYRGEIHHRIALKRKDRGEDPESELKAGIDAYDAAIAVNPEIWNAYAGAGIALLDLATSIWERGADPEFLAAQCLAQFERAKALAPSQAHSFANLGEAHLTRASWKHREGENPEEFLKASEASFHEALIIAPEFEAPRVGLARIAQIRAERALARGDEAKVREWVALASEHLAQAFVRNQNSHAAHFVAGEGQLLLARVQDQLDGRNSGKFGDAIVELKKAIELNPNAPEYKRALARAYGDWALSMCRNRNQANGALDLGFEIARQLAAAQPASAETKIVLAKLALTTSQCSEDRVKARQEAERASSLFIEALKVNANLGPILRVELGRANQLSAGGLGTISHFDGAR